MITLEDVDENDETLKKLKELETDIMDDLANDRNVSDDVEKMLQKTLTVRNAKLEYLLKELF